MAKSEQPDRPGAAALLHYLSRVKDLHRGEAAGEGLSPRVERLREWQSRRLAHTHADLMADSRFRPAMDFFLEELYGPKDFSQRDADVARVYPIMVKVLPERALAGLAQAMELNALSHELDAQLIEQLEKLGAADEITEKAYAEAYRRCDNYDQRVRQIDLIQELGMDLDHLVHMRFVNAALKLARKPAKAAGFVELQDFLEMGFSAFRHMKEGTEFVETIVTRERELLDRIYAGENHPYGLD